MPGYTQRPPDDPGGLTAPGSFTFVSRLAAVDPALRTRRLADSLTDVAFASTFAFMFGGIPFISLIILGYLAMGLADLGRLSSGTHRLALRGAAALAAIASILTTSDVWVDSTWLAAGSTLAVGFGLLLGTIGMSGIAAWFGGAERWQRARAAGVVAACTTSFVAGMLLQSPNPKWVNGIELPDGTAGVVAIVAFLGSLLFIGIAWSDLRDRVKAAIARYDAEAAAAVESLPSEQLRG